MADVSLDDLIKKDKEIKKSNVPKVIPVTIQKLNNKKFQNKPKNHDRQDRQDKQTGNQPRTQNDNRPPKQKFIKKRFDKRGPVQTQDNRPPRQENIKNKPQRENKKEEAG